MLITIVFSSCSYAENKIDRPIFDRLIRKENVTSIKVPAFVVRYILRFTDDTDQVRKALKGATSFRFAIRDNLDDSNEIFDRINHQLNLNSYTNIMEINDGKSKVTIKLLENNNLIREIVFLVSDQESFICFSMKGNINPENLTTFLAQYDPKKGFNKS